MIAQLLPEGIISQPDLVYALLTWTVPPNTTSLCKQLNVPTSEPVFFEDPSCITPTGPPMHRDSVITACDISQSLRLKSPGTRTQWRLGETEESEGEENAWPACQVAIFGPTRPPSLHSSPCFPLQPKHTHTCAHTDTRAHTFTL